MVMTRSSTRKSATGFNTIGALKRNREAYTSDLPAEKPRVANGSQPKSEVAEAPLANNIQNVAKLESEDKEDEDSKAGLVYEYNPRKVVDLVKDKNYYYSLVTLRVENQLFRLPRQTLEYHSGYFTTMFTTLEKEGKDPTLKPIALQGMSAHHFRLFVGIFNPSPSQQPYSAMDWISVLYVAFHLSSTEILRRAKKMLETDPIIIGIPRLNFAQLSCHVRWYEKGVYELATRKEPLSLQESEDLGLELVVKINIARSNWRDLSPKGTVSSSAREHLYTDIRHIFKPELDDLRGKRGDLRE